MANEPQKIPVAFYETPAGGRIVRDWLKSLDGADRRAIGLDLMRVQFRWPVGMPLCGPLGGGLWEVRTSLSGNRIARLLFAFVEGRLIALHGSIKKTQKIPAAELEIARKRLNEYQ